MFCSSCGASLARQTKYCKSCGAQLSRADAAAEVKSTEKRLREELVDLFWVTVFGLAFIVGGMALIKNALHLSDAIAIVYMILSSIAFSINFGLSLWQIRRLAGQTKEARGAGQIKPQTDLETNDLGPGASRPALEPVSRVTENTTRELGATPGQKSELQSS
jgi:hypothetical protein